MLKLQENMEFEFDVWEAEFDKLGVTNFLHVTYFSQAYQLNFSCSWNNKKRLG